MKSDDVAEHGTPEMYREQAERLTLLAAETSSHVSKLEFLEMAAVFLRLAERASLSRSAVIDAECA